MTSFDYRLNPLYLIKECSSCGALYTTDYCCSVGILGDKIICDLDKTPDLSQRSPQNCPKCGNPVDDSFEPSNDNTNVANALREPFVSNQDPEDIYCHQCTCELCGRGAHYGYNCPLKVPVVPTPEPFNNQTVDELPQTLPSFDPTCYSKDGDSYTYDSTSNFVHDSPNVFSPSLQPQIYSYEFCGNDAYYGQDCLLQVPFTNDLEPLYINAPNWDHPIICYDDDDEDYTIAVTPSLSTEEPDNSLSIGDEHLDIVPATKSDEFIKSNVESHIPIPSESEGIPDNMCDVPFHDNSPPLDVLKDQFGDFSNSNDESTSTDDDSFFIDNIEYVEVSPPDSEPVSSQVMEIIIPLLIANIEALKDNPTPSSDFMTKSSSTSLNSLLEETNTFDNSLPELETFCFDLEEISSSGTIPRSDISLPAYEAFYDDHAKEINSCSTTTHSDSSLYDSFIFDLLINSFPPTDRSDFYEFADELTHIISLPEYDCFCFKIEPNSGDFTIDVVKDIFPTREPRVHNVFPTHPTLQLNLDFILRSLREIAYVVWIFLLFLSYSVAPQYLLSLGNEDTIFDPGICSYHISSFLPDASHRKGFCPQVFISSASLGNHKASYARREISERGMVPLLLISSKSKQKVSSSGKELSKVLSPLLSTLLEETSTFDNSLPKLETFCFDLEEISNGSTTTRSDISLPDYEVLYDNHVKEISSGSTTTHSDSSLYDSFICDLLINPFPPADSSDFYEFADELTYIISPPEYDCCCFKIKPNSRDFTMDVVEDISPTREPRVHNSLATHPNIQLNMDFILSSESLFAYVVWIFLPFLS
nr:hypothetical protein [Tanacetum cinerariifolium]